METSPKPPSPTVRFVITVQITDATGVKTEVAVSELQRMLATPRRDRWWTGSYSGNVETSDGQIVILMPTDGGRFLVGWIDKRGRERVVLSSRTSDESSESICPRGKPRPIAGRALLDADEAARVLAEIAKSDRPMGAALWAAGRRVVFIEEVFAREEEDRPPSEATTEVIDLDEVPVRMG